MKMSLDTSVREGMVFGKTIYMMDMMVTMVLVVGSSLDRK